MKFKWSTSSCCCCCWWVVLPGACTGMELLLWNLYLCGNLLNIWSLSTIPQFFPWPLCIRLLLLNSNFSWRRAEGAHPLMSIGNKLNDAQSAIHGPTVVGSFSIATTAILAWWLVGSPSWLPFVCTGGWGVIKSANVTTRFNEFPWWSFIARPLRSSIYFTLMTRLLRHKIHWMPQHPLLPLRGLQRTRGGGAGV